MVLFLLTGGFAASVNLVARYLLTPAIGFGTSVVVAYMFGMVVAYVLFRAVVFGRSGRSVASESYRFVIVNVVALCLVWLISISLDRIIFPFIGFTWHARDFAHLIGVLAPAVSSYIGHRSFTFAQHKAWAARQGRTLKADEGRK